LFAGNPHCVGSETDTTTAICTLSYGGNEQVLWVKIKGADGTLINASSYAFNGGTAKITGPVEALSGGRIVTGHQLTRYSENCCETAIWNSTIPKIVTHGRNPGSTTLLETGSAHKIGSQNCYVFIDACCATEV